MSTAPILSGRYSGGIPEDSVESETAMLRGLETAVNVSSNSEMEQESTSLAKSRTCAAQVESKGRDHRSFRWDDQPASSISRQTIGIASSSGKANTGIW